MNGSKPGFLYWRDHWRRWKRMPRGYWIFLVGFMAGAIFEAVTRYI